MNEASHIRKWLWRSAALSIILSLVSIGIFTPRLHAEPATTPSTDVVIVWDTSYSMKETDPEQVIASSIPILLGLHDSSQFHLGIVAYNHLATDVISLTKQSISTDSRKIEERLGGIPYGGYSDLGEGLKKGVKSLLGPKNQLQNKFVIVISDGGIDLPEGGTRQLSDSLRDIQQAVVEAKEQNLPIYTITIDQQGASHKQELARIASTTGGKAFVTSSVQELPKLLATISAIEQNTTLKHIGPTTLTGNEQTITVPISNDSMHNIKLLLFGKYSNIDNLYVNYRNNTEVYHTEQTPYTIVSVNEPKKGNLQIKLTGTANQQLQVYQLNSYNAMTAALSTPYTTFTEQIPVHWTAQLHNIDKQPISDSLLYQEIQAELNITNTESNQSQQLPMKLEGDRWTVPVTFKETGKHTVQLNLKGKDIHYTAQQSIDVTELPAASDYKSDLTVTKEHGSTVQDIPSDFEGKQLADSSMYYLVPSEATPEDLVDLQLQNDKLSFTPKSTGTHTVPLLAVDSEGSVTRIDVNIQVTSIWTQYGLITVGVLIFVGLGVVLWQRARPRPPFTGRIEGCFLSTASGAKYPVKVWSLTYFKNEPRIDLRQLFMSLDTNEPLSESSHIIFEPGYNGRLLFTHNTRCQVVLGMRTIPANKKIALNANDRIYITFEDGRTEIELWYQHTSASKHMAPPRSASLTQSS